MRRKASSMQGDLFEAPEHHQDQNRVRELDRLIAQALKKNDYMAAKKLTAEQEQLIQKLVESGDSPGGGAA